MKKSSLKEKLEEKLEREFGSPLTGIIFFIIVGIVIAGFIYDLARHL